MLVPKSSGEYVRDFRPINFHGLSENFLANRLKKIMQKKDPVMTLKCFCSKNECLDPVLIAKLNY